jgi:hypothetical protein
MIDWRRICETSLLRFFSLTPRQFVQRLRLGWGHAPETEEARVRGWERRGLTSVSGLAK